MTSTFLLTLNHGDDTDLLGISDDIVELAAQRFDVVDCKPWAHPSLSPQPALDVPAQQ